MTPKLTAEQRQALSEHPGPVAVEDAETKRLYYLVDSEVLEALRRQEDLEAIREGLADVAAGRISPLDEAMNRIRERLGIESRP